MWITHHRFGGDGCSPLYRCGAAALGAQLGHGGLGAVGTLLGVLKLVLNLAVFGEVDGGNLLLKSKQRQEIISIDRFFFLGKKILIDHDSRKSETTEV